MPLGEAFTEFDIDPAAVWPVEDSRLEPILLAGPLWVDFDEEAQFEPQFEPQTQWDAEGPAVVGLADREEFDELDPERLEEPADESPAATGQRAPAIGVAGSVGVHLLVLLGLLTWSRPAGEVPAAIPVQLVVMQEKAADSPATPTEVNGAATAPPKTAAVAPPPPPPPLPPPSAPSSSAAKPTVPRPAHLPERAAAPNPPQNPNRQRSPSLGHQEARTSLPAISEERTHVSRSTADTPVWPKTAVTAPRPAPASQGAASGPAMTRDQYYAYLVALTRQHLNLLPQSVVSGRSGRTLVSVQVLRDGTITHIGIAETSGYPDIDARIEQMVAAVRRFPPLPAVFQGAGASLEFRLLFPDVYGQ